MCETLLCDAAEMDDLLRECFFEAVKRVGKNSGLCPLLTSTFYRSYMVEAW